jgi:hypothetical protein
MPIDIDTLTARIELLSDSPAPSGGGDRRLADEGRAALKEALRPVVVEILAEELEAYMRSRG